MSDRRRVDWDKLPNNDASPPLVRDGAATRDVSSLLTAFDGMVSCDNIDAILKRAVELAREQIGLERVAIYLRDEAQGLMRGTWGTNLVGATVDEHAISFGIWNGDKEFHEGLAREGVYWTVLEQVPLVDHLPDETRVFGHGWVCCTPLRSGLEMLGMMFNDAGTTGVAIDDAKQSQVAVLCSLVGTALDLARRRGHSVEPGQVAPRSHAVAKAARLLAQNPAMTGEELGAQMQLSASRVARLFKAEMGMSLVEYRNRLRLERFSSLLDEKGDNLLEAALEAGFGSYTQFHRVFVALRGTTPGKFLRTRATRQKWQ